MKKILIIIGILSFFACKEQKNDIIVDSDSSKVVDDSTIIYPKEGNFYPEFSENSVLFANPIIYDVIVKNPDPTDDWTESCLENTDLKALTGMIFNAIYQKKLIPYHYRIEDSILPLDSVKAIEKSYSYKKFGKIQFEEEWYFDETNLKFYKKVKSMIFGYELRDYQNFVYGYKAFFKVYLDSTNNIVTK